MTSPRDAMWFDAPSERAWRVLIGVTDALAQELDADAFERAVDELAAWAERFSDDLRLCPMAWIDMFFRERPDPRLKLVRGVSLYWGHFGYSPKNFAGWASLLAAAPHVDRLRHIELVTMQPGVGAMSAIGELFAAARPSSWRIVNSKAPVVASVVAALTSAGVTSRQLDGYAETAHLEAGTSLEGLAKPEVHLELRDGAAFAALLAREDLDHVVSLQVRVATYDTREFHAPTVATPRWERLKFLGVYTSSDVQPETCAQLARWLHRARPVCVELDRRELVAPALRAGMYARAQGSVLDLHDLSDATEAFAADQVRVLGIAHDPNAPYGPDDRTATLLAALPASTRAHLRVLDWPLAEDEFATVETMVSALPSLAVWCPRNAAVTDQRDVLLAHLAAAPSTARVRLLIPHEPYRASEKTPPMSAKQLKVLEKGRGVRPGAYAVYNNSNSPFRVAW